MLAHSPNAADCSALARSMVFGGLFTPRRSDATRMPEIRDAGRRPIAARRRRRSASVPGFGDVEFFARPASTCGRGSGTWGGGPVSIAQSSGEWGLGRGALRSRSPVPPVPAGWTTFRGYRVTSSQLMDALPPCSADSLMKSTLYDLCDRRKRPGRVALGIGLRP